MEFFGYFLAIFIGITLGLIGSGGSIIAVPVLVYILHVEPVAATAYSLFAVGITALIGGIQKAKQQLVAFDKVLLFGIPTIVSVFITRKIIVPNIPEVIYFSSDFYIKKSVFIMIFFAVVMFFAALKMIRPTKEEIFETSGNLNYLKIISVGFSIGLIAGFIGAGGGFLIVPALFFLSKTPMKIAVGTSLFIIASQSLIGFLGDFSNNQILDWKLILTFTSCAIIGIFIGNFLSKKIDGSKLKTSFGYFVLLMAIFIIIKEVFTI
jgi:uncharacterized protein